jgi:rhamnulokinase
MHHYVACDLGAESGRVMLGTLDNGRLTLEEIHRFANGPVAVNGSLRWDVLRIFDELKAGLRKVAARGIKIESISTDSWGVDYVLLRNSEPLLTPPYHYRDARTDGALERAFAVVPADEIFAQTGIQFMPINTLYQLLTDQSTRPWALTAATQFLNIADYFNWLLCGVAKAEESLASTTQLYDPRHHRWSETLIRKFKLPQLQPEVVASGTILGPLLPAIAEETGARGAQVVASCSHDTAAAVAAVPAKGNGWAYISSGTWSLLGIECPVPIITDKSRHYNFTNEVGYGGSIRFLKNIIGLWIQQECRRAWQKEGRNFTYEQLGALAAQAASLKALINPNDPRFGKPDNMPQKIVEFCRQTGQMPPTTEGEFSRCVLESIALLYRKTLEQMEDVTGKPIKTLHIVGGGSQSVLLNQLSANATDRTVVTGPAEATATGNILIQAIALGHLKDLDELRQVVRNSFAMQTYKPQENWDAAYERFQKLAA